MSWLVSGAFGVVRDVALSFFYDPVDLQQTPPPVDQPEPASSAPSAAAAEAVVTTATVSDVGRAAIAAAAAPTAPPIELTEPQKIEAFYALLKTMRVPHLILNQNGTQQPADSEYRQPIENLQRLMRELKDSELDFRQLDTIALFTLLSSRMWDGHEKQIKIVDELKRQLMDARDTVRRESQMDFFLFKLLCLHIEFPKLPEEEKQALLKRVNYSELMRENFIDFLLKQEPKQEKEENCLKVVFQRLGEVTYAYASANRFFSSFLDPSTPLGLHSYYGKEIFSNLAVLCYFDSRLLPLLKTQLERMNSFSSHNKLTFEKHLRTCEDQLSLLKNVIALCDALKKHLESNTDNKPLASCVEKLMTNSCNLRHYTQRINAGFLTSEELEALAQYLRTHPEEKTTGILALNWVDLMRLSDKLAMSPNRIRYLILSPLYEDFNCAFYKLTAAESRYHHGVIASGLVSLDY